MFVAADAHLYKVTADKRKQQVEIWTGAVDVATKCATMCLMNIDCWSFNVIQDNNAKLTCELNAGHSQGSLNDDPQSLYYGEKILLITCIKSKKHTAMSVYIITTIIYHVLWCPSVMGCLCLQVRYRYVCW